MQQNEMEFCKNNYCFKLLNIGEFISTFIAIIGIAGVVISLDAWKSGQLYIDRKDNFLRAKITIQNIKDELIMAHASKLTSWDHFKFISMLGKLSIAIEEMQEVDLNEDLIKDVEIKREKFFECIKNFLSGTALLSDQDIKLATSSLINSLHNCLEDLNDKYKVFKLKSLT
ncbi:hypothetical protein [Acinetobacter bereziniae]|uniref:hypothetical protein n=1 Tax=Acinetobacter bereziniae TaxID=106648 RepID=UPI001250AFD8|nr:hypothetical protein [Acinetobacter bereziniae]